jgi:hypothetical protein
VALAQPVLDKKESLMELKVPYAQITDKKQGYEAAKKLIPEVIAKFNVKADIKNDDANSLLTAKGSGFEAKIQFTETEAIVNVDLGFLLKPFKGKILEVLEKQIKKVV